MHKNENESWHTLRKQLSAVRAAEGSLYSAWKDHRSIGGGPQTLNERNFFLLKILIQRVDMTGLIFGNVQQNEIWLREGRVW